MTPADLNRAMRTLGLTQDALSKLCGVDRRTVWRWQRGRTEIPVYAQSILSLLQHVKALERHYDVPAASRLSTGSRRARNPAPAPKAPTAAAR